MAKPKAGKKPLRKRWHNWRAYRAESKILRWGISRDRKKIRALEKRSQKLGEDRAKKERLPIAIFRLQERLSRSLKALNKTREKYGYKV